LSALHTALSLLLCGTSPGDVTEAFNAGDSLGALAIARRCAGPRCKEMELDLVRYIEQRERLDELRPNEMLEVLRLAQKLGGKSSPVAMVLAMSIRERLGGAEREAMPGFQLPNSKTRDLYMAAYAKKQTAPEEAAVLFRQIVDTTPPDDPYHDKAKWQLVKLEYDREEKARLDKAEHLYGYAVSMGELDPAEAIRIFRQVVGLVPPNHPLHHRAVRQIEAHEKRLAK